MLSESVNYGLNEKDYANERASAEIYKLSVFKTHANLQGGDCACAGLSAHTQLNRKPNTKDRKNIRCT